MIGLYVPGDSVLHRAPAGAKVLGLALGLTAVTAFRSVAAVLVALAVIAILVAISGVGPATLLAQLRPLLWVLLALGTFQTWTSGWRAGVTVCGSIVLAVLAAGLVTATTRTEDLVEAVVRGLHPLRPFGVAPERVALLLTLVIRTVPVLARIAAEVREARIARGAQRSARALAVPLAIRTVRHADRLGEALIARGADD